MLQPWGSVDAKCLPIDPPRSETRVEATAGNENRAAPPRRKPRSAPRRLLHHLVMLEPELSMRFSAWGIDQDQTGSTLVCSEPGDGRLPPQTNKDMQLP
jgi:hypothetical protein